MSSESLNSPSKRGIHNNQNRLDGAGRIGTLGKYYGSSTRIPATTDRTVNGAGLAMNTVDAITQQGGACANFLDTGGKATAETVKSSFRIVGADPRVRAIFVNIFGGLTRCNMIAEGVIMAFRDLDMQVPVVVRLRGTFEEIGQTMVSARMLFAVAELTGVDCGE